MIKSLGGLLSSSELAGHTYRFVDLVCNNLTWFVTEAALERNERVVSGAPRMPEMKAEVATVTLHRSDTRLETAQPRTAQGHCAPLRAFFITVCRVGCFSPPRSRSSDACANSLSK